MQPGDTLEKISERTGVSVEGIKKANGLNVADGTAALPPLPVIPGDRRGDNTWTAVPRQDLAQVENALPPVMYRVRKGESLWLIGRNLGIAYQNIMKANHLSDDLIYPAQELVIPVLDSNGVLNFRIKAGDTFYFIGQALGINYEDIMSLNGFTDSLIYPEQELKVPDKTRSAIYKVQEGDTLSEVARKFATSVSSIMGNRISGGSLYVGQTLVIPIPPEVSRESRATTAVADVGSNLELLARTIYAEARGEIYEGKVAVGGVIMNRLKNAAFPKTIKDIILQPGAFTSVDDGQINLTPDTSAYKAAQEALDGSDPSVGAIYYWNPRVATSKWIWTRPIIKQIGNHVFAR